jgi:hypothetical protein
MYLKGQRDTPQGVDKFMIGCNYLVLMAIFDAQGPLG